MKKLISCLTIVTLLAVSLTAHSAGPTRIEVLYMNHGPLRGTISKMRDLFSGYGDRLAVSWYDFDSSEGEQFMAKKGIKQHVPLIIWIDGKPKAAIGPREVTFAGFPTGAGPAAFQGKWTMDDLKIVLDQATVKK